MNVSTKQAKKLRKLHPTVKPTAMLMDILLDASEFGDIVLDCFGGSGSTLIAAHQCGRRARLIELSPHYCDVIIARWEELTGQKHQIIERIN
jgi:DNA modification methylase